MRLSKISTSRKWRGSCTMRLILFSFGSFCMAISWSCKAHFKFHSKSPIVGLSIPCSAKCLYVVSPNFRRDTWLIVPTRWGSMIWSRVPLFFQCITHFAVLTCSLGRVRLITGLAYNSSINTAPNEYTSIFSVSYFIQKYSGWRHPKEILLQCSHVSGRM